MVARSIGEVEYRAIVQGVTEVLRLKSIFSELGYSCVHTPIIWSDNLATKSMVENLVFHSRTKHIEIDIHFVTKKVEKNEIEIRYVFTSHQVADVFIKGLQRIRFKYLCDKLHMRKSPIVVDSCSLSNKKMSKGKSDLRGNVEELA